MYAIKTTTGIVKSGISGKDFTFDSLDKAEAFAKGLAAINRVVDVSRGRSAVVYEVVEVKP